MEALITITGHVGTDVEHRIIRDTWPYASFRMACTPRTRRSGEWVDAETTWIGVTCSRALAEHVKSSISRGDPVIVVGRLRTSRWKDMNGVDQSRLTIEATTIGHDLTRGVASFSRAERPAVETGDLGELIVATEAEEAAQQPAA